MKKKKNKKVNKRSCKEVCKEIAIKGSNTVLGLEEYLDRIVAELIGVELKIIKIAR